MSTNFGSLHPRSRVRSVYSFQSHRLRSLDDAGCVDKRPPIPTWLLKKCVNVLAPLVVLVQVVLLVPWTRCCSVKYEVRIHYKHFQLSGFKVVFIVYTDLPWLRLIKTALLLNSGIHCKCVSSIVDWCHWHPVGILSLWPPACWRSFVVLAWAKPYLAERLLPSGSVVTDHWVFYLNQNRKSPMKKWFINQIKVNSSKMI